jgi:hypothetical protein
MSPKRLEKTTERHAGQFRPRIVTLEHFNYAQEVIKYFHNVHVVTKKQIMRANRVLFGMKWLFFTEHIDALCRTDKPDVYDLNLLAISKANLEKLRRQRATFNHQFKRSHAA